MNWKERKLTKDNIIELIGLAWIVLALGVCLYVNAQNLRFWVDEGMLAYSVCNRSLAELAATPLDWNQSAPILYIYIVKIISMILGNSEFTLRLCSLISYAVLLVLFYDIVRNVFAHKYPALETAFLAGIPVIMGYAQEFKPYMTEAATVLLVFRLFHCYRMGKLNWYIYIALSGLCIGLGNPVCFLIGGTLLVEFLSGLKEKKGKVILQSIIGGVIIMGIFTVYYIYWLSPVIHDGYTVDFWDDYRLLFDSKAALVHSFKLLSDIMRSFGSAWVIVSVGCILSLIINLTYEHNQYIWVIAGTFAVTLTASAMGRFPVKNRLYLFAYPFFVILFFQVFNRLWDERKVENIIILCCAIMLLCSQGGIWKHMQEDHYIFAREEIRNSIEYVRDHIEEDEKCYVYYHALPVFWYENGYANSSIGEYQNNLIFGKGFFRDGDNQEDVDTILNSDKIYILISHKNTSGDRYRSMLVQANDCGNLEKVMDNYDTPLYYYVRDSKDRKFGAEMEVANVQSDGIVCDAVIRITNTGEACMNNGLETITLRTTMDSNQDIVIPISGELPIGDTMDVPVHFKWEDNVSEVELHLKREGKLWMDEQGVAPVTIYR